MGLSLSKTFGMRLFSFERIRETENEFSAKLPKIWHDLWAENCVTLRISTKRKDRFVVHNGHVTMQAFQLTH